MKRAKQIKRRFSTKWPAFSVTMKEVKPSGVAFLENWMNSLAVAVAVKVEHVPETDTKGYSWLTKITIG